MPLDLPNTICPPRKSTTWLLLLLLPAMVAVGFALRSTHWGIGVTPDSVMYVGVAQGLLNRRGAGMGSIDGWYNPVVTYMPGTSALYAIFAMAGLPLLLAAKVVSIGLFAITTILAGVIVYVMSRGQLLATLVVAFLTGLSPSMLMVHSFAWSEPPFIALLVLAMGLLATALADQRRGLLAVAAAVFGAAYMTRYAALPFIAAGGLTTLFFSTRKRLPDRLIDSAIFSAVTSGPPVIWMLRNHSLNAAAAIGRPSVRVPMNIAEFQQAAESLGAWVVPAELTSQELIWMIPVAIAVGIAAGIAANLRLRNEPSPPRLLRRSVFCKLLITSALIYPLFLCVTMIFFDPGVRFEPRMLAPLSALMILAFGCAIAGSRSIKSRVLLLAVACTLAVLYAGSDFETSKAAYREGLGYSTPAWRKSATLAGIKSLDKHRPLYSNAWDLVLLKTGRYAPLISAQGLDPQQRKQSGDQIIAQATAALRDHGGVLILFKHAPARPLVFTLRELEQRLSLKLLKQFDDGAMYVWKKPPATSQESARAAIPSVFNGVAREVTFYH